ncbi:MAG: helix-turn-helix transcriptional regulator [Planctomycetes bacterium]|nr:helix-turn-helix transcriptional regulator [Planctomycetota bacterium]
MAKIDSTRALYRKFLPRAAAPRNRDLLIQVAGHIPAKAHRENQVFHTYGVGLVASGRGDYRAGKGGLRSVEPGCMFTVYPGTFFDYGPPPGATWDEYYFSPAGPGVKRWIAYGWLPVDGSVHAQRNFPFLRDLFRELFQTLSSAGRDAPDRAVCIAERLLVEMYHGRTAFEERVCAPSIHDVLACCRHRFAEDLDFEALARAHAISYSTLRHRLREITGLAPAEYLTSLRCIEARRLLAETELAIKEIAQRVGIPDPYSFSRVFKRTEGQSPLQFRERLRPWTLPRAKLAWPRAAPGAQYATGAGRVLVDRARVRH